MGERLANTGLGQVAVLLLPAAAKDSLGKILRSTDADRFPNNVIDKAVLVKGVELVADVYLETERLLVGQLNVRLRV
jgi:hypothetical protein